MEFVQLGEGLGERYATVGGMQVENVDRVRAELFETSLEQRAQRRRLVIALRRWVDLKKRDPAVSCGRGLVYKRTDDRRQIGTQMVRRSRCRLALVANFRPRSFQPASRVWASCLPAT